MARPETQKEHDYAGKTNCEIILATMPKNWKWKLFLRLVYLVFIMVGTMWFLRSIYGML